MQIKDPLVCSDTYVARPGRRCRATGVAFLTNASRLGLACHTTLHQSSCSSKDSEAAARVTDHKHKAHIGSW